MKNSCSNALGGPAFAAVIILQGVLPTWFQHGLLQERAEILNSGRKTTKREMLLYPEHFLVPFLGFLILIDILC